MFHLRYDLTAHLWYTLARVILLVLVLLELVMSYAMAGPLCMVSVCSSEFSNVATGRQRAYIQSGIGFQPEFMLLFWRALLMPKSIQFVYELIVSNHRYFVSSSCDHSEKKLLEFQKSPRRLIPQVVPGFSNTVNALPWISLVFPLDYSQGVFSVTIRKPWKLPWKLGLKR